jgi:mycoredoxin
LTTASTALTRALEEALSDQTPTIYSTQWCGYCHRLMKQLDREGVAYQVVDIEHEPKAAEFVMSVNGGNQTVPTVLFADGSALTNPSAAQVKAKISA